jgi:transcriptional regulator with XRE-family HTH domain
MYRIIIKKPRRRKRMSQRKLAEKAGISTSYISHLESDNATRDRTPTLQVLESIALSLKMCVKDIIMYPCVECPINSECTNKKKDMRDPDEIIDEILNYYL